MNEQRLPNGNLIANGRVYLFRCPMCLRENYGPMVARGLCAWCAYEAKKDDPRLYGNIKKRSEDEEEDI